MWNDTELTKRSITEDFKLSSPSVQSTVIQNMKWFYEMTKLEGANESELQEIQRQIDVLEHISQKGRH